MPTFNRSLPLSLYVHIPWCERKCSYCDFNSHEAKGAIPERAYVDALLTDLEQDCTGIETNKENRKIESIFIGGGTPSLFSPESIDRLLQGVRNVISLAHDVEITLEANPGTIEQGKFSEFHAAGINRLSIGIQSFQDEFLQKLGRIHGRQQAISAVEQAHDAGFDNFNLDLMFGLPGQNLKSAMADINTAIDLEPSHVSWYQLTIEPNTFFHHKPPVLPEDDLIWQMQMEGQGRLTDAGYNQYEISAYAKRGKSCRHNQNYWLFGDYLGIGAGAHAKLTDLNTGSARRYWKHKNPSDYMDGAVHRSSISGSAELSQQDLVLEFMMNALRLTHGFDSELFAKRTGLDLSLIEPELAQAEQKELIQMDNQKICPTQTGQRYLNDLLAIFMCER